jgi:hypothetical protein
LRPANDTDVE